MKFAWIAAEKASFRVSQLCRVLAVAPSGYYAWVRRDGRFVRAGAFTGAERVVPLTMHVDRGAVVAITSEAAEVDAPSAPPNLVAIRP